MTDGFGSQQDRATSLPARPGFGILVGVLLSILCQGIFSQPIRAEIPGPKHEIGEVRFENDGEWFIVSVPTQATWAHWTLANPPRIIVDFGDAVSRLPEAPGLYEIQMDRGPVRIFRTSQFSNTPLDRRVRMTIELSAITAYEARRVGEEIRILVESPGVEGPSARLTAGGMVIGGDAVTPTPPKQSDLAEDVPDEPRPEPHARVLDRADASPESSNHPGGDDASDDHVADDHVADDHVADDHVADDHAADDHAEAEHSVEEAAPIWSASREEAAVSDPIPLPEPPSSHDADHADAREDPHHGESTAADSHDAGTATDTATDPDIADAHSEENPPEPVEDPYAKDLIEKPEVGEGDIAEMKSRLEELLGKQNVDQVTETARGEIFTDDELRDRIRKEEFVEEGFGEEDWDDWQEFEESEDIESPDSLRTRRAALLLRAAVEDWLEGDLDGAIKRADRCHRFYGDYPGGMQAGLLLRETYLMTGREALAKSVRGVPELPDTSFFRDVFFERLLAEYYDEGDDERLLDRMEYWGPFYPDGSWYAHYHYLLGREAYIAQDAELAEEHLGRVSLHDKGGDAAFLMRARLADEADRIVDALVLYRELAFGAEGPYALRAFVRVADLEFQRGRIDVARQIYTDLLEKEIPADERSWALYQVANCALMAGDSQTARQKYEALTEELPNAYWSQSARERLTSVSWEGDVARRVEEMRNP